MLIGLSGAAGVGKDTVAGFLVKNHGFKRYAFADAVRDVALSIDPKITWWPDGGYLRLSDEVNEYGWDFAKRNNPEVRRLLQVIGTEAGRQLLGENVWVDIVARKWEADGFPDAVVTDMRFPNEIAWIDSHECNKATVRIERPDNPNAIAGTHASEKHNFDCDYAIINNGTLEALEQATDTLYAYVCEDIAFQRGG